MRKRLNNNNGFSELVGSLIGLMVITIMLVISITFIRVVNHQSVLNEFGNQMIQTVSDYGKTSGTEIDARYEQLVDSLHIEPDISYSAYSIGSSRVQYGELITLSVTSETQINMLGFDRLMEFEITKTGRSKYYWK